MMNQLPLQRGTMVFWIDDPKPYWVVQWQPHNGPSGAYWLVDATGTHGVATEAELSLIPAERKQETNK